MCYFAELSAVRRRQPTGKRIREGGRPTASTLSLLKPRPSSRKKKKGRVARVISNETSTCLVEIFLFLSSYSRNDPPFISSQLLRHFVSVFARLITNVSIKHGPPFSLLFDLISSPLRVLCEIPVSTAEVPRNCKVFRFPFTTSFRQPLRPTI